MVEFKGFDINVQSKGLALKEHETNNDDSPARDVITRYIEAKSGAPFSIVAKYVGGKNLPGGSKAEGVAYHVKVDGNLEDRTATDKHPFNTTIDGFYEYDLSKCYLRKPKFSNLKIVEDLPQGAEAKDLHQALQKTGTIEITVHRFRSHTVEPTRTSRIKYETALTRSTSIPEKALKGDSKSQFVRLGKANAMAAIRPSWNCDFIDKKPNHFAKFVFKYRSRKALEELHVIERPLPLEERNMAELDRDELVELVSRLRQSENTQSSKDRTVKAEALIKAESSLPRRRAPKRERDAEEEEIFQSATTKRIRQLSGTEPIVVLDLTED